jgi:hypothetical protein
MDIDAAIIRIAFFALPGLLASKLYRKLRGPTRKRVWEDFVELLLFTTLSYLPLAAFPCGRCYLIVLLGALDGSMQSAASSEIISWWFVAAIGFGAILAFFAGGLHKNDIVSKLGQKQNALFERGMRIYGNSL